ncbi:hypothetical protein KKC45_01855 [Patescibacteria group bacterium]|nr:hypothetical protein [Patescibacteria group bacterium]
MEDILENCCSGCGKGFSYEGIFLTEDGNFLCSNCHLEKESGRVFLEDLQIPEGLFEKPKKLFLVRGRVEAFCSADELNSPDVRLIKDFFVPDYGEEIFFKKNERDWFIVVLNRQDFSNTWSFYQGDGSFGNWVFPGELCFEIV